MLSLILHIGAGLVALLAFLYYRIARAISYPGGVPCIGKPGVFGYISTALRYTLSADKLILEGREQFGGRPYVIPTLAGSVFILPPQYLDRVRSATDAVFSQPMAINDSLQLKHTMNAAQMENPYQATVVRTDINRAIPALIPELLDESIMTMNEVFDFTGDRKSISIPIFETMTHMIARISNRVIFDTEMCRNEKFLHAIVRFAETLTVMSPFIRWSPDILRPAVYFVLSSILGGKKDALKFIVPYLRRYKEKRQIMEEHPNTLAEFMIKASLPGESDESIAIRLMNMNFGSIHTSSIFITQTLFELALLPASDLDSMRAEISAALESEGGWNKAALLKFRKVDSALREVGRVYGLMHFALPRFTAQECDLGDGTSILPGYMVAIDMKAIHFDPTSYPDPERCDLFRFSKLRDAEETDTKYGFATVDNNYLPFGAGRHACAGRFFAATELKMMIAHILLNYDFKFPEGRIGRPDNLIFDGAIVPDPKAHMVFSKRV